MWYRIVEEKNMLLFLFLYMYVYIVYLYMNIIYKVYKYIGIQKILRFSGEDELGRATTPVFIFEDT